ncbi:hypothetical protein [Gordonia aquimaris]|uniref:hypothetical protein n=1 Tax=Gordonia aquimaris TaxID=2984863 RepID=UPI0035592D4C
MGPLRVARGGPRPTHSPLACEPDMSGRCADVRAALSETTRNLTPGSPLRSLKTSLECDRVAYGVKRWSPLVAFRYPTLSYQRYLRYVEFCAAIDHPVGAVACAILRLRLKRLGQRIGVTVPPGVFGPGLSIPHYGSVVVNDKVRAGWFCRIHSATNLGESEGAAPCLGDGVYIGPGAVLYGAVTVGSGSVIGANSVVNRNVPANSLAVGSPAQVRPIGSAYEKVMPATIIAGIRKYGKQGPVE